MTSIQDAPNPIAAEHYGSKTVAVEPGGVEVIPDSERHGHPRHLLWTWSSPNLEFATVAVGILGPLAFGLTMWQSIGAIVLGTALGSLTHGILSTWGPPSGLCQMVLSRIGFGYRGNIFPSGINAVIAGIGWFAVNTISGALALHALVHPLPDWLCVLIIVAAQLGIAFFGHNLVQAFERYAGPALAVIFAIGLIYVFTKAHPGAARISPGFPLPLSGGFLIETAAAFGYACGWNPYASDYTRYLPARTSRAAVGLSAAFGLFIACVLLESGGAAMVTALGTKSAVDPGVYTGLMPTVLGDLTLLCIAIGAVAANVLNIYSGAMSFLALGVRIRLYRARSIVTVVFGVCGFILALVAIANPEVNYENFLLIIAYWIGPWLGVVLTDRFLRRGRDATRLAVDTRYQNWAGPIAMAVGVAISIWLFSNQTKYVGLLPYSHPGLGDITFLAGFVIAAVLYAVLRLVIPARSSARPVGPTDPATELRTEAAA
ncbi:MAG TPA: cytosine permease [Nocardioidaceae bacterium]|nr:cytosine permease [Nocardioidaceae bacterium]